MTFLLSNVICVWMVKVILRQSAGSIMYVNYLAEMLLINK